MVAKYRSVLSIPGCARVFATALVGRLPQGMSSLAILLLVRAATHSYPAAGVAVGAFAFATAAASPLQGRLVDRHGRGRVLVPVALVQGALLVALVLAAQAGAGTMVLVGLSGACGALSPAIAPSVRALLGEVAGDREVRETAYSLESVIQELIWITGPLLVAVVVAFASPSAALLLSAACGIVGTLLFARSPLVKAGRRRGRSQPSGRALAMPELRVLLAPMVLMGTALGAIEVGIPSLALHAGSRPSSGLLLALWSLGSLTGGLWYGSRTWRAPLSHRYRLLTIATVISTAPLIAARTIPEGMIAALLAGVTIAPAFSCLYALVGRVVTPGAETEAFTWAASSLIVGLSIGSALGGVAIDAAGVSGPFVLSCLASGVTALLALRTRDRAATVVV
jgi:MFS family permease